MARAHQSKPGFTVSCLRFCLQVCNAILALAGLGMLAYALYMLFDVKGWTETQLAPAPAPSSHFGRPGNPWFVYAFGGVGIFVFATAITGLVGAARSIRWCLNLYSTLVIVLLVAEGAMIVAYFADDSWQKRLPHDDTGEAKQIERFLRKELRIVQWVALAAFVMQVLVVMLACALTQAQQNALLENESDEEDEIWGRRRPLLADGGAPAAAADPEAGLPSASQTPRTDPWSLRMRDKYGLDTSQFTYDPARGPPTGAESTDAALVESHEHASRRCTIM